MRSRWIVLLLLLLPTLARAQTDYSVGTLSSVGTGCTINNSNDHVAIYTTGTGSAVFTTQGTFVGTVSFFGSGDGGTSWGPLGVTPSSGGAPVQTTTTTGIWQANTAAYTHVCMMLTAYTSGTVFAKIHTSPISARTGGGGGGGGVSLPMGAINGQSLGVLNNMMVAFSPGLSITVSNPSPVAGPFTPSCGSTTTNTGDRGTVTLLRLGAVVTMPVIGPPECNNAVFYFAAETGPVTFQSGTNQFMEVLDGDPTVPITPTYSLLAGQYLTAVNVYGTVWRMLVGGSAQNVFTWSNNSNAGYSTAIYYAPVNGSSVWSANFPGSQQIMPRPGTITGLTVNGGLTQSAGGTLNVAVQACTPSGAPVACTGVDTAVTCTVPTAGSTCSDTAHSYSFMAGDMLNLRLTQAGAALQSGGNGIKVGVLYQ